MKKIAVLLLLALAGILTACNTPNSDNTIDPSSLLGVWENTAVQTSDGTETEMHFDPTRGKTPGAEMRVYRCFSADCKMYQACRIAGIPEYERLYQLQSLGFRNATYSISGNNAITFTFETDTSKVSETGTIQISGDTAVLRMYFHGVGTATIRMKRVSSPTQEDIVNAPLTTDEDLMSKL